MAAGGRRGYRRASRHRAVVDAPRDHAAHASPAVLAGGHRHRDAGSDPRRPWSEGRARAATAALAAIRAGRAGSDGEREHLSDVDADAVLASADVVWARFVTPD